jgi:NAD(P)H-hydrate epimerase
MPVPLLAEVDKDRCYLLDKGDLQELLIPRTPDSHKGTHGTIGIVTGSSDMAGAALMAGKGALRAGAGKIFLRVPSDTAAYCIGKIPEIMVKGIGKGGHFTAANAASVINESKEWDAIAMGPGLGKAPVTKAFIKKVISDTTCPIVLDADAINLLKDEKEFIKEYGSRIIMTPHLGEFSRLTNLSTAEIKNDIVSAAKSFVMDWNVTLVLKGASTVIVDSESHTAFINPTGNAGMATAGMGDILTGMITALLCHEGINSLFQAACAAVYLHGAAGDSLMENYGPYGYSALDLADEIPTIIAEIENED